jgi:hypothetical protein
MELRGRAIRKITAFTMLARCQITFEKTAKEMKKFRPPEEAKWRLWLDQSWRS